VVESVLDMFRRIAWATDGSSAADNALAFARALVAHDPDAQLVVVHVDEVLPGARAAFAPLAADEVAVEDKIRGQIVELRAAGLKVSEQTTSRTPGEVAPAIAELADAADADVIVVGTRGRMPLTGLLLGSVSQRLLHIARQPVLMVPPTATPPR